MNLKLYTLRSDRGGEYTSREFIRFGEFNGINKQVSIACMLQQNGTTERKNRIILERVHSMLFVGRVPIFFWTEAAKTGTYFINKSPTRANLGASPDEVFFRSKPYLIHLRIFGSLAYAHLDKT